MASRSQKTYMTAVALAIAASEVITRNYHDKPGRVWLRTKNAELKTMADNALLLAHGELDKKQLDEISNKVGKIEKAGLDKAESCRSYLAMLIAITGDLLVEIPKTSNKYAHVDRLNAHLVEMWEYFSARNQREDLDTDGWAYAEVFTREFKDEAA